MSLLCTIFAVTRLICDVDFLVDGALGRRQIRWMPTDGVVMAKSRLREANHARYLPICHALGGRIEPDRMVHAAGRCVRCRYSDPARFWLAIELLVGPVESDSQSTDFPAKTTLERSNLALQSLRSGPLGIHCLVHSGSHSRRSRRRLCRGVRVLSSTSGRRCC